MLVSVIKAVTNVLISFVIQCEGVAVLSNVNKVGYKSEAGSVLKCKQICELWCLDSPLSTEEK